MKPLRLFLFLLLLLAGIHVVNAQRCYYRSFQDLDSGRYLNGDFRLQRLSVKKLRRHLGPEYKLKAEGNLAKQIEDEALFLQIDSALYVNCRSLKCEDVPVGKGFAPCIRTGNDRVAFISVRRDRRQQQGMPNVVGDMLLPDDDYVQDYATPEIKYNESKGQTELSDGDNVLTRLAYALDRKSAAKKKSAKVKACYFLFKVEPNDARNEDTRYMRFLLSHYPDLQSQYMKLDRSMREDPLVIWQYLGQLQQKEL